MNSPRFVSLAAYIGLVISNLNPPAALGHDHREYRDVPARSDGDVAYKSAYYNMGRCMVRVRKLLC
jgi:hypothetical protein